MALLVRVLAQKLSRISQQIDTTLRFVEKFEHQFSHVFIFVNMLPESHGLVAVSVTSSYNFVSIQ